MDEIDGQERERDKERDDHERYAWIRSQQKEIKGDEIPRRRKAAEIPAVRLHPRIGKIDGARNQDRRTSDHGKAGRQDRAGDERKCRHEYITEIVDDEV